jgi:hypothetical protein
MKNHQGKAICVGYAHTYIYVSIYIYIYRDTHRHIPRYMCVFAWAQLYIERGRGREIQREGARERETILRVA